MSNYIYINIDQLINIHAKTVEYSGGGAIGHYDLGLIESVLENIQNDLYYPRFEEKLTHLFFCLCKFHCFHDGNKRIAITASTYFLLLNGYMAIAKNFLEITENISYQVAAGRIDKELLLRIIIAIMDGTYENDESLKLAILNATSE